MSTVVLAAMGDTHTNSYVGACVPYFEHRGGTHKAGIGQRWLWSGLCRYYERVQQVAEYHDAKIVSVLNGDLCDKHPKTTNLITQNETDMMRLAYEVHKPLVEMSERVYVIDGTKSHVFGIEEKIAEDIGAVENKRAKRHAWPRLHLTLNGVRIWFAHHGKMGRLGWTKRNAGNKLAAETLFHCAEKDIRIPDLVFRSHQHRWADSHDNYTRVRGIFLPAWQLPTGYIMTLDADAEEEIGGVIVVIKDGEYTVEKFRWEPAADRPEKVTL